MKLPDPAAGAGPEPYDQKRQRQQQNHGRQAPFFREKAKDRNEQKGGERDDAELNLHRQDQIYRNNETDRAADEHCQCRPGTILPKGKKVTDTAVQKKPGQEAKISCVHIDVPDGSLKFRMGSKTPAGRVEAERIAPEPLHDDDDSKKHNAGTGGE